jgi:hypothetical protein
VVFPPDTKRVLFSRGWWYHPRLKISANRCYKITVRHPLLVSVGNSNRDLRWAAPAIIFWPHRWKAFSPGSKVEPGLKGRIKDSDSTSDRNHHKCLIGTGLNPFPSSQDARQTNMLEFGFVYCWTWYFWIHMLLNVTDSIPHKLLCCNKVTDCNKREQTHNSYHTESLYT